MYKEYIESTERIKKEYADYYNRLIDVPYENNAEETEGEQLLLIA